MSWVPELRLKNKELHLFSLQKYLKITVETKCILDEYDTAYRYDKIFARNMRFTKIWSFDNFLCFPLALCSTVNMTQTFTVIAIVICKNVLGNITVLTFLDSLKILKTFKNYKSPALPATITLDFVSKVVRGL